MFENPQNVRLALRDPSGSVLPIGAVGMLVVLMLSGAAVDYGRAYMAKSRLQAACDAGSLAGRKAVTSNGFDDTAEGIANDFFNANFEEGVDHTDSLSVSFESNDDGNTVNGTATGTVNPLVLQFIGVDAIDISANCTATMSVGNSDVTMVLDVTGSMAGTRIAALRTAMKNFYDTVATATAGSNARVRYGFVPYSSAVNVGDLLMAEDPSYVANTVKIQSREPKYTTKKVWVFDHWSDPTYSTAPGSTSATTYPDGWSKHSSTSYKQNACNSAKPGNSSWSNSGSPTSSDKTTTNTSGQLVKTTTITQLQTATHYQCTKYPDNKYYIEKATATQEKYSYAYETRNPIYVEDTEEVFAGFTYKQVEWDVSSYKTGGTLSYLNDSGTAVTTTWDGCVQERQTVNAASFTYSTALGYTPGNAYDLEIDAGSEDKTGGQWLPMVNKVAYLRGYWDGSFKPQNVATYGTGGQPGSLFYACPAKAQLLTEMTEKQFDDYADSLKAVGSTWHDIGAIWGGRISSPDGIFADNVNAAPDNGGEVARHLIFMTDGEMNADNLVYSSYGIEFHDKLTTTNGSSNADARHDSRFKAVCEAIKAKGIRLWVIAFGTSLTSSLTTCASTKSAYAAKDAASLNASFQEIAKQVGELRITQ